MRPPLSGANLLALLFGLSLVGLVELGLWVGGFGPANRLFLLDDDSGSYRVNPDVSHRFFPPHLRRSPIVAKAFPATKAPGTVRVFTLGASTLVGFPNPLGTEFPRFLEFMLADVFPQRQFEIVNCGITAINSHCLLDFAREVVDYDADLLVVYGGHNEFIGPYGPTTPFVRFGNARPLIRLHMLLERTRLHYGLKELAFGLSSLLGAERQEFGLHLVTQEIDLTQAAYASTVDNYRANLDALAKVAQEKGVGVLLGTLVSNLKGFYPLRSECDAVDGVNGEVLAAEVTQLVRQGNFGRARERVLAGLRRSPTCAAAHFEMARLHQSAGRHTEALASFVQARDLDRVPFRAPAVFNSVLRETAADYGNVTMAEVESAFAQATPDGIVGNELMSDYLHPTVYGHHLLAQTLTETLANNEMTAGWGPPRLQDLEDFESYRSRLGHSELEIVSARNNLILFLRNMPYRSPPELLRERVAGLIEEQAAAYLRLGAAEREAFRRRGGLAFLTQSVAFVPAGRQSDLQKLLRSLTAQG